MAAESGAFGFSVVSVVENVLQQHGNRSRDLDLDARRAEEAAMRRYEAAAWLRKVVGVVGAKDLPAEPTEEELRLGLRSGIILCNVINKVQAGAVQKIVESPCDASLIPDGAALSAYQYFENVRNFLVAVQNMGIPTFEASDLEQGGKTSRVVNCILALKSFSEWKQNSCRGVWKFGGNVRSMTSNKQFVQKHSEPFTSSLSRTSSLNEKSSNALFTETVLNKTHGSSLNTLIRAVLLDKKPDEVPNLLESVLNKVVEEFEQRVSVQIQQGKTNPQYFSIRNQKLLDHDTSREKVEMKNDPVKKVDSVIVNLKQQMIVDKQRADITELKQTLSATKSGMQFMQSKFHQEVCNLDLHIRGLAHAASGYHRVLEENRKLYNQVQDLKGSIRVYCRVRPFLPGQTNYMSSVDYIEEGSITINTFSRNAKAQRSFHFSKVFGPSSSQEEVFADTQPLIRSVLDGYNVCIFAYGQTGSGKTYTMSGPKVLTEENQGVNYRALDDLFLLAGERKDIFSYDIYVQMIEIYNEQVRDLLVAEGSNRRLEIRNTSQTGLSVPNASLIQVKSSFDVIELMNVGQRNRSVGATALNDRSSRSHSCLTVHVQGRDLTSGTTLHGCMHLVDLAGSERVDKSEVTGDRLKEAQHINRSLSALGDVISSLAQKNVHVPYRNSKLTQLLQDSLGGQAKTLMFVHISPEPDAVGETISTLKFAERVSTVELGAARVNKDPADVKELKEQIAHLKAALARKEEDSESKKSKVLGSPFLMRSSPVHPKSIERDLLPDMHSQRIPMGDVGNIEVCSNAAPRQTRQIFNIDEQLGSSPLWPPVIDSSEHFGEDDKELNSGEWVDKVMVNKQDHSNGTGSPLEQWGNGSGTDFYQKYISDPYGMFRTTNPSDTSHADDLDEFDVETTDSSEPDLVWQYNHSKTCSNNIAIVPKVHKPNPTQPMGPEYRSKISKKSPSTAGKLTTGAGHLPQRSGRTAVSTEAKRKIGNRK